jgi:aspartate aminotransferase
MIPISEMATSVQPSATLAASAKASQLKAAGVTVFDFSLGEPDFPTPEHICQAASRAMQEGHTHYTAAEGTLELRTAISRHYRNTYGLDCEPCQVLVSNGAKHALHNAVSALCNREDEVIIPTPYWVSYSDLVQMTGARPVLVPTPEETGFRLSPKQLRAALTRRTRVLMLNSPCNPTGTVYTRSELEALGDVILESRAAVISDEIYERLVYGGCQATCFAALRPDHAERTITISGASKTYAMTGWRMGWSVGPKHIIRAMASIQSQQTSSPSSISQQAALAALLGDQECVSRMRHEFEKRRDLVVARLAALPGITCRLPEGAFYAFFRVANYFGHKLAGRIVENSVDFCRICLDRAQVNMVPGSAFGAEGFVRLSFAASREQLSAGLEKLEQLLVERPGGQAL